MKTPLRAFSDPPTMATMMNGQRILSGKSCKLMYVDSCTGSIPVKLAKVLAGIPMEPYVVGTELATRQTRMALIGSKPMATNIEAGIAIAVPKPAMPSMKAPKPQPMSRARTRRSLLTVVNMCLTMSMLLVYSVRLYVKIAAMMTSKIGQHARATPSRAAVAASMPGI